MAFKGVELGSSSSGTVISITTDVNEADILASYGLNRDPDGFIRWARSSKQHPRNWSTSRKIYDTTLVILLELYT